MKCPECNGRGSFLFTMSSPTCDACGGSGEDPSDRVEDMTDAIRQIADDGRFSPPGLRDHVTDAAMRLHAEALDKAISQALGAKADPYDDPRRPEFYRVRRCDEVGTKVGGMVYYACASNLDFVRARFESTGDDLRIPMDHDAPRKLAAFYRMVTDGDD